MANTDLPNGFKTATGAPYYPPSPWNVAATQTIRVGDPVYIDAAGRIAIVISNSTTDFCGFAASASIAAAVDSRIMVWDNHAQVFEGQCSGNGALADPFTCVTLTSCFDFTGTTGIFEINESASSQDLIKVIGVGFDPVTGEESAVGANQRKRFIINPNHHQLFNPA